MNIGNGSELATRAPSAQLSAFEKALHATAAIDDAVDDNIPTDDPVNDPVRLVVGFPIFGGPKVHQLFWYVTTFGDIGQATPTWLQPFEDSIGALN